MKLNEKQINIISVSVGALFLIIFAVMSYLDNEETKKIDKETEQEKSKIVTLKKKENEIKDFKNELFAMQQNFDTVKRLLPDEKKILDFYATMEQFRSEQEITAWSKIYKTKPSELETADDDDEEKKKAVATPTNTRGRRNQAPTGPFEEDAYVMEFEGTFHQLGELINRIERFERFFSVHTVQIGTMGEIVADDKNSGKKGKIKLAVTTFTFKNNASDQDVDEQSKKFLEDFKASEKLKQEMRKKAEELTKKLDFVWPLEKSQVRDIFDQDKVLTVEVIVEDPTKGGTPTKVQEVKPEQAELSFNKIVDQHIKYHDMFMQGQLVNLSGELKDNRYQNEVKRLLTSIKEEWDPEARMRNRLNEINTEINQWNGEIAKLAREEKIKQFLEQIDQDIAFMQTKYKEGKEKSSKETLKEVISKFNKIEPLFKEYQDMEEKYPKLAEVRGDVRRWHDKAEIQMKVIELAQNIKLKGVIYWEGNREASVAFLENEKKEKKVVREGDILEAGFEVDEIRNGEILLRHKEETVTIRSKAGNVAAVKQ